MGRDSLQTKAQKKNLSTLAELRQRCEQDFVSYIRVVAPYAEMGQVHEDFCNFLQKKEGSTYRLGLLPRAHRKSFIIGMYSSWLIVRNPAITILYLSATSDLAESQLRVIKQTLESPTHRKLWPSLINEEEGKRAKWTTTEICVDHPSRNNEGVRDSTVKTGGLTTTTTGAHADVIILDDLVEPNNNNPSGRKLVSERYSQLQSILNPDGLIRCVGTRYDPNDLYADLIATEEEVYDKNGDFVGVRKQWEVFQRVVETDGEFLWPRKKRMSDGKYFGFDAQQLARIKAGYSDTTQFFAQYYNDPNRGGSRGFSASLFQYYDKSKLKSEGGVWRIGGQTLYTYAAMDFGFTLSERADSTVIAVVGVDSLKNRYVLDIDRFKTDSIKEYAEHIIKAHAKWNLRKMRAEISVAQSVIVKQIKEILSEKGVRLQIEEGRPRKEKLERITANLLPLYEESKMWHYRGGNCELLEYELTNARPEHDDIKDALSDAVEIATPPVTGHFVNRTVKVPVSIGRFGGT